MPPKIGTPTYEEWKNSPRYEEFIRNRTGENSSLFGYHHSDEARKQMSKAHLGTHHSTESRRKRSERMTGDGNPNYGKHPSQETLEKISESKRRENLSDETRIKIIDSKICGLWYGNVRYRDPPIYCELWGKPLWHRIDEAQNYQSILSGKTKEDNTGKSGKPRALSRHHVYWQPRACCEWDEDAQGYYAWIEIGTKKHPNKVKYYISGDPNKFVLLTMSEHQMIKTDKIKWIELFEELIEIKLGGVCYLPKENP